MGCLVGPPGEDDHERRRDGEQQDLGPAANQGDGETEYGEYQDDIGACPGHRVPGGRGVERCQGEQDDSNLMHPGQVERRRWRPTPVQGAPGDKEQPGYEDDNAGD